MFLSFSPSSERALLFRSALPVLSFQPPIPYPRLPRGRVWLPPFVTRRSHLSVTLTKRRYSTGVVPFALRETTMRGPPLEGNMCLATTEAIY